MRVWLDLQLNLLQEIRLAHAIAETGLHVCLSPGLMARVSEVTRTFGTRFSFQTEGAPVLGGVEIDHSTPRTRVGRINRPLILPHGIGDWARDRWPAHRHVDYSFCGLLTRGRYQLLEAWLRRNGCTKSLRPAASPSLARRLLRQFRPSSPYSAGLDAECDVGRVSITSSSRGRAFPGKSWDDSYFRTLLKTNYVLCPNGDHVWTYRFFEATLCGAIPIVQDSCAEYEGFRYYHLDDRPPPWSIEVARSNFALCLERLTVPQSQLREEVERLVTDQSG